MLRRRFWPSGDSPTVSPCIPVIGVSCVQHADVAVNKILIGNKCDMDEDREVSRRGGPHAVPIIDAPHVYREKLPYCS